MSDPVRTFEHVDFADAEVIRLSTDSDTLQVHGKDWQERPFRLIFTDVVGYEVFSIVGEDLSHGSVSYDDPFIARACRIAAETPQGFCCFALWSAWADDAVLRVVARHCRVEME
jgi:hypothetical protein